MLQHLYVKNLALIKEIGIEFTEGFNVLTGETGAGKSMLMGSLGILMGQRAYKDLIGSYDHQLYVEGVFQLSMKEEEHLKELEIECEDGQLILSVTISDKGKLSRCNSKSIPASLLKQIGQYLITVHGQHESQILLNEKAHLQILDTFGKENIFLLHQDYLGIFRDLKKLEREILKKKKIYQQYYREKDLLVFEIDEINQHIFKKDEDLHLENKYQKMKSSKKVLERIRLSLQGLENSEEELGQSIYQLNSVKEFDESCNDTYSQLLDMDDLCKDILKALRDIEASLDFDEEEFEFIEDRLEKINHLKNKYGESLEEILKVKEEKENILESIQCFATQLKALKHELIIKRKKLEEVYFVLLEERKLCAKKLEEQMIKELLELNFEKVDFKIQFTSKEQYDDMGRDEVTFLISTNEGITPKPIKEIASGGELSRIMLCLKKIIAAKEEAGAIIFDEVDSGISGVTADKVGSKLEMISQHTQVICITHLAQIAARARQHLLVEKSSESGQTVTSIHSLGEEESIQEIARILGGSIQSPQMLESAREMKNRYKSNS